MSKFCIGIKRSNQQLDESKLGIDFWYVNNLSIKFIVYINDIAIYFFFSTILRKTKSEAKCK